MAGNVIHVYHEHAAAVREAIHAIEPAREVAIATNPAELPAMLAEAEVLCLSKPPRGSSFTRAPRLRLVQAMGAGVEEIATLELPSEVLIASARGLFAAEAAEHAIAGLLALARGLTTHGDRQRERAWRPFASRALEGRSLAIVGLGAIGTRVARAAAALGMRPLGVRRTPRPTEHLAEVGGPSDLPRLFGEADHLVICAPLTVETRGLVDARALACLRREAWVVNVARGGVVDEHALLDALRTGRVGGAFLDVFEEEPLPTTSPWWNAPNVMVTSHVAGLGVRYLEKVVARLLANVGRLGRGEPLHGAVERARGY